MPSAKRRFYVDEASGIRMANPCPDCHHTKCGEDCVCDCDLAHIETELATLRAKLADAEAENAMLRAEYVVDESEVNYLKEVRSIADAIIKRSLGLAKWNHLWGPDLEILGAAVEETIKASLLRAGNAEAERDRLLESLERGGAGRCGCDHAPCRHDAHRFLDERDRLMPVVRAAVQFSTGNTDAREGSLRAAVDAYLSATAGKEGA